MTSIEVRPRSRGLSYQELLDTDTNDVPAILRREQRFDDGPTFVPVERYISPEFFQLERTKVWDRTWQMACREEHLPDVGDHIVYDVAGRSYLVVRSGPSTIQAFHNVCLHRGRLLRTEGGCRATEFRCPFHGFGWKIDGSLSSIPCAWDFPQVEDPADWGLREVQVGTWGGFVFINPDPAAPTLTSYVGELTDHFARWPLEDRFVQVHVAKIIRCNWKVAQEAFMEAMHVVATHPQILPSIGDANSQYDVFGNFSRAITANGTPSPHLSWAPSEQEVLDSMYDRNLDEPPVLTVPAGRTARQVAAESRRGQLRPVLGAAAADAVRCRGQRQLLLHPVPQLPPVGSVQPHRLPVPSERHARRRGDHGVPVPLAVPAGRAPTAGTRPVARRRQRLDRGAAAGIAGPGLQPGHVQPPQRAARAAGISVRARHVRPLRGVQDPPLAHAPRRAPGPTVKVGR